MTGRLRWEELEGRRFLLYLPPGYPQEGKRRYPVFYASDGDAAESVAKEALEGLETAVAKGEAAPFLWVCAAPLDREREYTPWPAPGLSKKGAAFAGQGNAYLAFLEGRLKPWVDRICRTQPAPAQTGLMGYSLGGLLAVYSLFTTETFGCVASLSGSLWYDGFAAFVQRTLPVNPAARVYLSLGKGEGKSRNPRMAAVAKDTQAVREALEASLFFPPEFAVQEGGHFTGISGRFRDALLWFGRIQKGSPAS